MKKRNETLNIARGFAIILVVVGHIIQYNLIGSSCTSIFKIIYTFHMPLFFLLSGYVSFYSKPILTLSTLGNNFIKKTFQLYIPYLTFGFIVPLLCRTKNLEDLWSVITNPQNGPWFLATLWMTQNLFMIVEYGNNKFCHSSSSFYKVYQLIGYLIGLIFLFILNYLTEGSSYFTAIYYISFIIGRYFATYSNYIFQPITAFLGLLFFLTFIPDYIYSENTSRNILTIFQICLSTFISVTILYICKTTSIKPYITNQRLTIIGKHSLNIYLMHYAFIQFVNNNEKINISINPIPLFIILFILAYLTSELICFLSLYIIEKNRYLNFILFGKIKREFTI